MGLALEAPLSSSVRLVGPHDPLPVDAATGALQIGVANRGHLGLDSSLGLGFDSRHRPVDTSSDWAVLGLQLLILNPGGFRLGLGFLALALRGVFVDSYRCRRFFRGDSTESGCLDWSAAAFYHLSLDDDSVAELQPEAEGLYGVAAVEADDGVSHVPRGEVGLAFPVAGESDGLHVDLDMRDA